MKISSPEAVDLQDDSEDDIFGQPTTRSPVPPLPPFAPGDAVDDHLVDDTAPEAEAATEPDVTGHDVLDDDGLVGGIKSKASRSRQGRKSKYQPKTAKGKEASQLYPWKVTSTRMDISFVAHVGRGFRGPIVLNISDPMHTTKTNAERLR
jgi:hypothetical protein